MCIPTRRFPNKGHHMKLHMQPPITHRLFWGHASWRGNSHPTTNFIFGRNTTNKNNIINKKRSKYPSINDTDYDDDSHEVSYNSACYRKRMKLDIIEDNIVETRERRSISYRTQEPAATATFSLCSLLAATVNKTGTTSMNRSNALVQREKKNNNNKYCTKYDAYCDYDYFLSEAQQQPRQHQQQHHHDHYVGQYQYEQQQQQLRRDRMNVSLDNLIQIQKRIRVSFELFRKQKRRMDLLFQAYENKYCFDARWDDNDNDDDDDDDDDHEVIVRKSGKTSANRKSSIRIKGNDVDDDDDNDEAFVKTRGKTSKGPKSCLREKVSETTPGRRMHHQRHVHFMDKVKVIRDNDSNQDSNIISDKWYDKRDYQRFRSECVEIVKHCQKVTRSHLYNHQQQQQQVQHNSNMFASTHHNSMVSSDEIAGLERTALLPPQLLFIQKQRRKQHLRSIIAKYQQYASSSKNKKCNDHPYDHHRRHIMDYDEELRKFSYLFSLPSAKRAHRTAVLHHMTVMSQQSRLREEDGGEREN